MLSRTPLSEAAFDHLCYALKAEIQELRDVAQQRYHDVAMPSSARPLIYRAEQRAQIFRKSRSAQSRMTHLDRRHSTREFGRPEPKPIATAQNGVLIRHIKGVQRQSSGRMPWCGRETDPRLVGNWCVGRLSTDWWELEDTKGGNQFVCKETQV